MTSALLRYDHRLCLQFSTQIFVYFITVSFNIHLTESLLGNYDAGTVKGTIAAANFLNHRHR